MSSHEAARHGPGTSESAHRRHRAEPRPMMRDDARSLQPRAQAPTERTGAPPRPIAPAAHPPFTHRTYQPHEPTAERRRRGCAHGPLLQTALNGWGREVGVGSACAGRHVLRRPVGGIAPGQAAAFSALRGRPGMQRLGAETRDSSRRTECTYAARRWQRAPFPVLTWQAARLAATMSSRAAPVHPCAMSQVSLSLCT